MNSTTYYNQRVQLSCSQLLDFVEKWNIGVKDLIYTFNLDEGHWIEMEQYRKSIKLNTNNAFSVGEVVAYQSVPNTGNWYIGKYSKGIGEKYHEIKRIDRTIKVESVRSITADDHLTADDPDNFLPAYKHNDMELGDLVWCKIGDEWSLYRFAEYAKNGIMVFDHDLDRATCINDYWTNTYYVDFNDQYHYHKLPFDAIIDTEFRNVTFDLIGKTKEFIKKRGQILRGITREIS